MFVDVFFAPLFSYHIFHSNHSVGYRFVSVGRTATHNKRKRDKLKLWIKVMQNIDFKLISDMLMFENSFYAHATKKTHLFI